MRRTILSVTLAGALLLACSAVALAQPDDRGGQGAEEGQTEPEEFAPGEVLVKFKDDTSEARKREAHEEEGGRVKGIVRGVDVQVVAVGRGEEKSKAEEYEEDPNVEFAEVNGVYEAVAVAPNDPSASKQWQYNNTLYTTTNIGDIDAYEAWNGGGTTAFGDGGTTGSSSVAIAILDTGVNKNHEDLQGKVTKSANFTSLKLDDVADRHGHGTHVAGSAAAVTNNGKGVAGTCPGCSLYNVKVLGDTGSGYSSWIADGISWAVDNGAKVINMSLGSPSGSKTLEDAVKSAWGRGVIVVAAAGNSNSSSQFYPAAYPNAIAVGATDNKDAKASFSNYGSSWVDVAAPGVGILSTTVGGGYGLKSDTSMASPHVAGTAGLIWSKSGLCAAGDNACVRNQLESRADPISGTGTYWARGRINANGGVGTTTASSSDTTAPKVRSKSPAHGKTGVWRGTNVKVAFSENVNPATVTRSTFTLVRSGSTTPISATVSYDSTNWTATLNPYGSSKSQLNKCSWYKATVTTGVKDRAGNPLAAKATWSFKTRC